MFNIKFLSNKWAIFCLLAIVVLAVFGRTIWFDYVQLDEGVLLENNKFFISSFSNFFEIFKHDINYPSTVAPYYRPMFTLSFMLNSQIGSSPLVYHAGNILLHILTVFAIFLLLQELGVKRLVSVFFSALFAIHPAVTPVVAWVPGRIEAILTIFTILSFVMFVRFLRTGQWLYLAGLFISFAIAIFTKEVAIALLPILLLYYLMHKSEKGSEMLVTLSSGMGLIIIGYFFVRKNVLDSVQFAGMSFPQMAAQLWSNFSALILYLGKAVLPFDLAVLPTGESSTLIYGFVAVAIIVGFLILRRHLDRDFASPGILGLLWFIVFLVPSLMSYNSPDKIVFFEHRLYLPLVGIIVFFATSLRNINVSPSLPAGRKYGYVFPAAACILFAILAFNYSSAYANKIVFWQRAVADSPNSADAHNGLATSYLIDGKTEEALTEFAKTLEINPKEKRVHLLLGLNYLDQNLYDKAKEEFEKEIEIDPNQFVAYHNLGRIYIGRKNLKEAEKYFLKAVEISPDYILAQQDLTVFYFSQNKHPQAIIHLKEILKRQSMENMHPSIIEILEIYAKEAAPNLGF